MKGNKAKYAFGCLWKIECYSSVAGLGRTVTFTFSQK
jgi:hypothetical protein